MNGSSCRKLMFAYDTSNYSSHTNALLAADNVNNTLVLASDYYEKWKIKINVLQTHFFFKQRNILQKQ